MTELDEATELEGRIERHRRAQILSVALGNGATLLMLVGLTLQWSWLAIGGLAMIAICFVSILWRGWLSAAAAKRLDQRRQEKTPA
ncbi:MAG: hypothetical protein ACIALR_08835 [Blastopirellula sp. JB062]